MNIKDTAGLTNYMLKACVEQNDIEHCAIAVAKRNKGEIEIIAYCSVEDISGKNGKCFVYIPSRVTGALLHICNRNNWIPIFFHSHVQGCCEELSYSSKDMNFFRKIENYARGLGGIEEYIFALTDGKDIMLNLKKLEGEKIQ